MIAFTSSEAIVVGAVISGGLSWHASRRSRKATEGVHREIQTNHGLRAGEYLEMMGDVVQAQRASAAVMSDHALADQANFEEIREHLARIQP